MTATKTDVAGERRVEQILEWSDGWDRWELREARCGFEAIDEDELSAFCGEAVAAGRAGFEADASVADVLRSLRLLTSGGKPSRGAIALFGRTEAAASLHPGLGIRLVAVAGTDITDEIRDDVLLEGNVFASIRRAVHFCEEHLNRLVRIEGLYAKVRPEVPLDAIREALVNAFAHRNYAEFGRIQVRFFYDRIEVWSPGALHFPLTPLDLYEPHESKPWNLHIFACLYRRGLAELLGSGTLRMAKLCREADLGRPVFAERARSVVCHIPRQGGYWLRPDGSSVQFGEMGTEVLAILAEGPATKNRIAERLGKISADVQDRLVRLAELGFVKVEGGGRSSNWMLDNG